MKNKANFSIYFLQKAGRNNVQANIGLPDDGCPLLDILTRLPPRREVDELVVPHSSSISIQSGRHHLRHERQ